MGKSCCVVGCKNRFNKNSELSFHRLPKCRERRSKWIAAIRRKNWNPAAETWICGRHFVSGKKSNDPLHPDYVPCLFSFTSTADQAWAVNSLESYQHCQEDFEKALANTSREQAASGLLKLHRSTASEAKVQTVEVPGTEVPTEETHSDVASLHEQIKSLSRLPNVQTFSLLFSFMTSVPATAKQSLKPTQELLITLMKLRLNLSEEFLGHLFGIDQSTVSEIFRRWIDVMACRLHSLILWPEREDLRRSLPVCFLTFFKECVSIIDCFEVLIECPSDLRAQAQTWSNHKQHNTLKFLISITPQGSISFVSKSWGGRVTDKHLAEHSGFLDKLLPGDLILSDQDFTAEDSVGLLCAELVTPPFTQGKKQLSRKEIESAQENSQVRRHVERVTRMLRQKYSILGSTLPVSLIKVQQNGKVEDSFIDKIVVTCCALCNLCESIVLSD
ncbi:protein ALP1-like isoform X2 [Parambassis ranga]|uniref:Protein ALP1-like isoform X2 n=1 Tax=Parambassis ranga TaxID=210632 RepID=A0A6P7JBF5_9TELE|nr:protein ALP1-like isoform X2 [Parambassis ranga]